MSEQDGTQNITLEELKELEDAREAYKIWKEGKDYWESRGQPWRREPEIDEERQRFLAERRNITPDLEKDIYPFKDMKLDRADVEWLLATHENGRGPIDWSDESQRGRFGLDLRGADLRDASLSNLPLACMGRVESEIAEEFDMKFHLDRNDAATMHLEGVHLSGAHLENADFTKANLEKVFIDAAYLERATFNYANLKEATICRSILKEAFMWGANLVKADLSQSHLEGAVIKYANLSGANLQGAFFDDMTRLNGSTISDKVHGAIALADVHWGDVNIAVVNWTTISILGDEVETKKSRAKYGRIKSPHERFDEYQSAVRAYRQLSVVLRNQGLNEDAARLTYQAQLMQRKVFKYQRKRGQYLFSLFLDLLSGYGYKPSRCFIAYLIVILSFALTFFIIGHKAGPILSPIGSVVFSMTSFHGRGFFPGGIKLDDPLTVVAALEAFIGLLIEVTFIATLTQRLFVVWWSHLSGSSALCVKGPSRSERWRRG